MYISAPQFGPQNQLIAPHNNPPESEGQKKNLHLGDKDLDMSHSRACT
jgi:hypothetical protein